MLNKPTYGSQPIKNEQDRTVKPYLFDDMAQHNTKDQGKYVSLVDLQEFIFNTCNVEDNTIFIDFHNYLQFLERQRNFAKQPHSNEWVKVEDVKVRIKSNIQRYNVIPALEKTLDWLDSLLPQPPKK